MFIVSGSASQELAKKISQITGSNLADLKMKRFPDGECHIKLNSILKGDKVVIVQTTYPDPNLVELLLLLDLANDSLAEEIILVIPYFAYGRQDRAFEDGECISARAIARIVEKSCDSLITVDIHKAEILEQFFNIRAINVSAGRNIAEYLQTLPVPVKPDMIISPDIGCFALAQEVAGILGADSNYLEKKRIDSETVEMKAGEDLDVEGRSIAIVDDIISTGNTIYEAAKFLRDRKASRIEVVCVHGLFLCGDKLSNICDSVASSDTIMSKWSRYSVADSIAAALQLQLH